MIFRPNVFVAMSVLLAGMALVAAGQTGAEDGPGQASWESPAAEVNGKVVTRGDVGRYLLKAFGREWLRTMLAREAVRLEAAAQGEACAPGEARARAEREFDAHIFRRAKDRNVTVDEYVQALAAQGRDVRQAREEFIQDSMSILETEALAEKLLRKDVTVSEEELKAAYEENYGPILRVRHIQLATLAEAMEVFGALEKGAGFAALAEERSLDKGSRKNGFELTPPPSSSSEIGRRARSLTPGKRAVVRDGDRYHVIELIEFKTREAASFEDASKKLREDLVAKKMMDSSKSFITGLMEKHGARMTPEADPGAWDATVGAVGTRVVRRAELAEALIRQHGARGVKELALMEMMLSVAAQRGASFTEEELKRYMAARVESSLRAEAESLGLSDMKAYEESLGRKGCSLDQRRGEMEAQGTPMMLARLLADKCLEKELKVEPAEVEKEYRRRYGEKVKARQIVVPSEADAERAEKFLGDGVDFGAMARQFSLDKVSGSHGGVLEIDNEGPLGEALFAMRVGERKRVRVGKFWHLVEKLEVVPAQNAPFGEVRAALERDLLEQRIDRERAGWIMELEAKASIKIFLR